MTSENPINQEQPTPNANGETNQHGAKAVPVISPTVGTAKPETPPSSQKCEQSRHKEKHWLDYLEAGMGGIGLIVLIVYTIFTALMYCANKKAAEAAKTSADFLKLQVRPWVADSLSVRSCAHSASRKSPHPRRLFEQTVSRMVGVKQLPYAKLVEENAFTPFVRHQ